jgi:hypothetical protein
MSFEKLRHEFFPYSTKVSSLLHQKSSSSIIFISVMDNFHVDPTRLYRRDFLHELSYRFFKFYGNSIQSFKDLMNLF